MKLLTKRLAIIFSLVLLGVVGVIVFVEVQASRSKQEIATLAAQFAPGTSFAAVVNRLGPPTRTVTTQEELKALGPRKDLAFIKDSTLHMFMRPGPPYRWLLVYTDRQSRKVSYVTWKDM
ncbi:MAG: hypothetical protein JWM16_856 [Verrucomicrobiales bacterium]|nr:hypothetical protein [Verrucomicrobiales bacterium]